MRAPRTLRARFTAAGFAVAALTIALLTLAFNLALERSASSDADNRLRATAAAVRTTVTVRHGHVAVFEAGNDAALDRQVWVYDEARPVERPALGPAAQRAAGALAGTAHVFRDLPEQEYRLYSLPLLSGGRQVGTVVTGLSLAAYDRTSDFALVASLALAVALLAAITGLTWMLVGRALSPVREMTRSAASWSAHGDPRRFGETPRPDELGELAQTFDGLLDRVAASLRHEQRLSAELSHELRTPLARIVAEVELLQRRERDPEERAAAHALIGRSARRMSEILETLMVAARADAGLGDGRCDVRAVLSAVERDWPAAAVPLAVRRPAAPAMAGVDREVVARILAPVLENARRYAVGGVELAAAPADGRVVLTVADDGPGVPDDALEAVFEPGARLGPADAHEGAGLGLALARRLARAAGGEVTVARSEQGGAVFRIELPA